MANVIFHIGLPKTGTTSIQNFLYHHAAWLGERGVYYPKPIFGANHVVELLQIVRAKNPNANIRWAARFEKLATSESARLPLMIEAVKNAREASTDSIISHEGFLKTISTRDHIEWLAEKFGRTNVKVILYLRRIDQWVEASISQRSKGVEPYSDEMVRRAARNRLESYEKIEQNLEVWEEIFGSQSIVVRPFERKSFVGGDVISDFAHALDLPELSRLFEQKRKNFRTRNLSPNVESVRLWPQFLSYPVSKRTELEKKIVYLLSSQQLLERLGPPRASFLSFEARTSLVQRVSGMYGRLAEKYLGQEKFFVDEGPQEGDFPEFTPADEKRTFEIMYDFLVESFRAEGIDAKVLLSERMKSGISDTKPERPLAT